MGSIRKYEGKRGVTWVIDYISPDGKRIRQSFKTRKQAQAELTARDYTIQTGTYTDPRKYQKFTLGQLCEKYIALYRPQRCYKSSKRHLIKQIRQYFGDDRLLISIRYAELALYRAHLEQTSNKYGKPRKAATINRTLSCLRHMMTTAFELDMMRQNPFDAGGRLHRKENNVILRFLSEDEITRLLAQCTGNLVYLHDIIVCAINTGMRKGEVLTLKWDQIRNGQIYLTDTKGQKPREVPINLDLEALFKSIRKRSGLRYKHVFIYQGKPITHNVRSGLRSALKRARIDLFRFHDLRHTAKTIARKAGVDKNIRMVIFGHSDGSDMDARYDIIDEQDLLNAVDQLETYLENVDQSVDQETKKIKK